MEGRKDGRKAKNYVPPLFFEKAGDKKNVDRRTDTMYLPILSGELINLYEPVHWKNNNLHMQKQIRRSASQ